MTGKILTTLGVAVILAIALIVSQSLLSKKYGESVKRIDSIAKVLQATLPRDTTGATPVLEAIHKAQLDLQRERVKVELEAQKQELFWYNVSFLGIGSILGFISLLWLIPNEIASKAKVAVDDKIADAIHGRSDTIRDMLRQYDFESMLLQTKKILIVGAGESQNARLKAFLEVNGFASHNIYINTEGVDKHDFDLFLLNNMDFAFMETEAGKTLEEAKKNREGAMLAFVNSHSQSRACFFYYSDQREQFPVEQILSQDLKSRINFANTASQIYGNIINMLKYQHKIRGMY